MDKRLWIIIIAIVIFVTMELLLPRSEPPIATPADNQYIELLDKIEETDYKKIVGKPVVQTPKPKPAPVPTVTVKPVGNCHTWMRQAGIAEVDMASAYALIMKESGCNPAVFNPSSGAGGIPQALPFSKMGCTTSDPVCQIRWMIGYVNARYGGFPQALAFQISHNWY